MVPVNGRPCISYILEQIEKLPFDQKNVVIVDGKFDDIREFVKRSAFPENMSVKCVKQGSLDGPLHAVYTGYFAMEDYDAPLLIWLGDAIFFDFETDIHTDYIWNTDFLVTTHVEDQTPWCMWDGGTRFYNKPKDNVHGARALVGIYYINHVPPHMHPDKNLEQWKDLDISYLLHNASSGYMDVEEVEWYDIGDIQNYHKTCAHLLTRKSREFNTLSYNADLQVLTKMPNFHSYNIDHAIQTINNELNWYREATWEQQQYLPRVSVDKDHLEMSYETGTLLSDMLMWDDIPNSTWEYLLRKIFHVTSGYFHRTHLGGLPMEKLRAWKDSTEFMWTGKVSKRMGYVTLPSGSFGDFNPVTVRTTWKSYGNTDKGLLAAVHYCRKIAEVIEKRVKPIDGMHGDLHLGNIIYNPLSDKMTFIDPRGQYGKLGGMAGDSIYDWAKLAHDVYWGYNHLITGIPYKNQEFMQRTFISLCKDYNIDHELAIAGGLVLLGTCVSLHGDNPNGQSRMKEVVMKNAEKTFDSIRP